MTHDLPMTCYPMIWITGLVPENYLIVFRIKKNEMWKPDFQKPWFYHILPNKHRVPSGNVQISRLWKAKVQLYMVCDTITRGRVAILWIWRIFGASKAAGPQVFGSKHSLVARLPMKSVRNSYVYMCKLTSCSSFRISMVQCNVLIKFLETSHVQNDISP